MHLLLSSSFHPPPLPTNPSPPTDNKIYCNTNTQPLVFPSFRLRPLATARPSLVLLRGVQTLSTLTNTRLLPHPSETPAIASESAPPHTAHTHTHTHTRYRRTHLNTSTHAPPTSKHTPTPRPKKNSSPPLMLRQLLQCPLTYSYPAHPPPPPPLRAFVSCDSMLRALSRRK